MNSFVQVGFLTSAGFVAPLTTFNHSYTETTEAEAAADGELQTLFDCNNDRLYESDKLYGNLFERFKAKKNDKKSAKDYVDNSDTESTNSMPNLLAVQKRLKPETSNKASSAPNLGDSDWVHIDGPSDIIKNWNPDTTALPIPVIVQTSADHKLFSTTESMTIAKAFGEIIQSKSVADVISFTAAHRNTAACRKLLFSVDDNILRSLGLYKDSFKGISFFSTLNPVIRFLANRPNYKFTNEDYIAFEACNWFIDELDRRITPNESVDMRQVLTKTVGKFASEPHVFIKVLAEKMEQLYKKRREDRFLKRAPHAGRLNQL